MAEENRKTLKPADDSSKYFKSKGVRLKLMLSFILLITVTTFLMVYFAYDVTHQLAHDKMTEKMDTLASVFSIEVEHDISRTLEAVREIAADPRMASMDKVSLYTYFRSRQIQKMNLDAIYVFDAKRRLIYSNYYLFEGVEPRADLPREPEIREAMKTGTGIVFPIPERFHSPGGVLVAVPVIDEQGRRQGIVVGEKTLDSSVMELSVKNDIVTGSRAGMESFLSDVNGKIIAHTRNEMISRSLFEKGMPLHEVVQDARDFSLDSLGREFEFSISDVRYIGTVMPVSKWIAWRIVLIQPYDSAFEPVNAVVKKILLIGMLAMMVGVGIALYRANRIIKPIGELLMAVEKISRGNYSDDVPVRKFDEIGSLAFAFNKMKQALVEKIQANQEYQTRLEEAFNQLQNDSRKREEANMELSRKVEELISLSEVTQAITNTLDLKTVLNTIVDAIARVMRFSMCSIKLLDNKTDDLSVEVYRGLGEEYISKGPTKVGDGISGLAVKMCKPIVVEDLKNDTRVSRNHVLMRMEVSSVLSYPLLTKNSVMGVLNLYTKMPHKFTEDEMRLLGIFANQAASSIENARLFETLRESYMNTIQALSMAIDAKDKYTHGHSKRVKEISSLIGKEVGLPPDQIQLLEYAADLHDIGKIGISELIISKQGKLSVDEYELIKTHPLVGETIIEPVPFLQDTKPIIRHHHERWDGYGYPDGLQGEEIPLLARIILIADAFDAMTSDRPYRKALSKEEAVREIVKHRGTQFDPDLVEAFLKGIGADEAEVSGF